MGTLLQLHAIWRWVLLFAAIVVTVKALAGFLGKQPFTKLDQQLGFAYTLIVDVQFLLGLIIWLLGPIGLRNLSAAMTNAALRFMALEHPLLMLIALVFAHIGRSRSRNGTDAVQQHRAAFIFYGLSLIFVAAIFVLSPR